MYITLSFIVPLDTEERLKLERKVLMNNRNYIVQYLNPDDVMDDLISKQLIGQNAHKELKQPTKTAKEKNRIIVDELYNGGPDTLERFCEILKENRGAKFMADKLEKGIREVKYACFNTTLLIKYLCIDSNRNFC